MPRINYDYEDGEHQRWKVAAARKGITLREWVRQALEDAAERQEAEDDRTRRRR